MPIYHHRLCDGTGRVLHNEQVEVATLVDAMVHANRGMCRIARHFPGRQVDPRGRIEIADAQGLPVARIYFAD